MTIQQFRTWLVFLEEFEDVKDAKDFHARYKIFVHSLPKEDKAMALKALLDLSFDNFKNIIENLDFQLLNKENKEEFLQKMEMMVIPLGQKRKAA
jgi:6-pyruvoyl-tetrahydropterin synthase